MKRSYFLVVILASFLAFQSSQDTRDPKSSSEEKKVSASITAETNNDIVKNSSYQYPLFYKGIYLNIASARSMNKLKKFVESAKKAGINTFVLDTQSSRYKKCIVPSENVAFLKENGIHPIARVVVFPLGLKYYPVSKKVIQSKLDIAESACKAGFKEIQFDYIRFNDSNRLRHLSLKKRYAFIEGFLARAGRHLKKYDVKIAADIFGRIPLNRRDLIGQRMEGLDRVVDIICPMAYPSHYTWSRKLQHNPYKTVYITSKKANDRTKKAEIVTYIQAFKMRLGPNSYPHYLKQQIKAVHDSGIRGFIFWNARQDYRVPFSVAGKYYKRAERISRRAGTKSKEAI